jgi:hypothetical protein
MNKFLLMPVVLVTAATLAIVPAHAQTIASDNAGNYTSWTNGSNQGTGFGAWNITTSTPDTGQTGFFLGTSAGNDSGAPGLPTIDTGGKAFGLYANSGANVTALRLFSTPLVTSNQFHIQLDNGGVDNLSSTVGFLLGDTSGATIFSLFFNQGDTVYRFTDAGGTTTTNLGFTRGGLDVYFSLTSPTTYDLIVNRLEGGTPSIFNTSRTFGGTSINRVVAFNINAGNTGDRNFYVNNLSVAAIPEPTTLALLGLGICGFVTRRRKK